MDAGYGNAIFPESGAYIIWKPSGKSVETTKAEEVALHIDVK